MKFFSRLREWEELCDRCGLCCYERELTRSGELIVELSSPCEFLDPDTRLCRVYPERFSKCPDCCKVSLFHAIFSRYLPPGCAYVRIFRFRRRRSAGESAASGGRFSENPHDNSA